MLRGLGRLRFGSVFEGLVELGPRLLTIPLVLFIQRTFLFYLYSQLAFLVLLLLISWGVIWRRLPAHNRAAPTPPGAPRLPPRYWLYATQLLLANILALLFVNVSLWMLRYYADPHVVGVFSVGQDVPSAMAGLLLIPLGAPLLYFYTLDEKLVGRSEDIQQGIVLISAIMGSLSLLLGGLATFIVRVVFGAEFSDAAPIFVIYALVPFLIAWHPMLNAFIYSQNQAHQLNIISAGQLVVLVGLSLWLIPHYGAAGAALAVTAAYVGTNIAYALLVRGRWPGTLTTLLRVYGLFVPFIVLGRTPFWYLGLVGYPGVLLLTRTLNIDRLRALVKSALEWRWRLKPSDSKVVEP
jgi:O-antigen/teichoic acid export membrane protein